MSRKEPALFSLTFVIPAYNEAAFIGRCIESIRAEAPRVPIVVVDNGSTDDTAKIALGYPHVEVISEPKKGITQARQRGLEHAITRWVAFIDADNELPGDWLIMAMHAIDGKGVVAASGPVVYRELMRTGRITTFVFYLFGRAAHVVLPMLQGGNFIVDRSAMLSVGGFDRSVEFYGEDTMTAKRLSKVGKVKFDLDLFCYSSPRRFKAEGMLVTGVKYLANYLWVWVADRPLTRKYRDHREAA